MKYLRRNINTVFLMLGNSCNMNCAYCLQHPLVHKPLSREVNPEIYDFLGEVAQENNRTLHLQFYGGEPLLYFRTIREVVEEIKRRKIPMHHHQWPGTNGRNGPLFSCPSLLRDHLLGWASRLEDKRL